MTTVVNHGHTKYKFQKITDKDLGQMYLVNEKVLITRSSSQILLFKQVRNEDTQIKEWKCYRTLNHRGFIFFNKGNRRIQITTDKKIFIYLMDLQTMVLSLENVIDNFINCSQVMIGRKVKYCISYKTNQKCFEIWRRQYRHSFNANVVSMNLNGSIGLPIENMNSFVVGRGD